MTKTADITVMIALPLLLLLMLLPLFGYSAWWIKWAFGAAALVIFAAQLAKSAMSGESGLRTRRLLRMNAVAGLLYCAAAACLFIEHQTAKQSWVPLVLAGAVMQLYATLCLPGEKKR